MARELQVSLPGHSDLSRDSILTGLCLINSGFQPVRIGIPADRSAGILAGRAADFQSARTNSPYSLTQIRSEQVDPSLYIGLVYSLVD